jgi:hypothetical protein
LRPWRPGRQMATGRQMGGRKKEGTGAETKGDGSICQLPSGGHCTGWPRGRRVEPNPRRLAVPATHAVEPNGCPRPTQRRNAASSVSVCGVLTSSCQSRGQPSGHALSRLCSSAGPCSRSHRLDQRHCSARFTKLARRAFRST